MHKLIALATVCVVFLSRGDASATGESVLEKLLEELAETTVNNIAEENEQLVGAEEYDDPPYESNYRDANVNQQSELQQLIAKLMHYSTGDSEDEYAESQNGNCIKAFEIRAVTGDGKYSAFRKDSRRMKTGKSHYIVLTTANGRTTKASLPSPALRGERYWHTIPRSAFNDSGSCLQPPDISRVQLEAGGNDGWFVTDITTYFITNDGEKKHLTQDIPFKKWVDRPKFNTQKLSLIPQKSSSIDRPECGYGTPVCECREYAQTCVFFLEVDEIMTFTSYEKYAVGLDEGLAIRGAQGVLYNIDESTGEAGPHPDYNRRKCAREENKDSCTDPQYVDGKNYRMVIAVNGQIPGPTFIVHEGQTVVIHVHNNLTSEGISIHWHGMHQIGSPWMDGVGQVTQCHTGPASSYSYQYVAKPSGTFWYHSHSGAQRTDGFYGALVVKEKSMTQIQTALSSHGVGSFKDMPQLHTLSFLDWHHEISLDVFARFGSNVGFFPDVHVGEVPSDSNRRYRSTRSMEKAAAGQVPYSSGLINGKGRYYDVPYSQTRLSVFTVEKGQSYRFRLVGAQALFAYRFSIDGHKLTVVGTDGYWMKPEKNVDFIIIHSGERYDFILDADQDVKNYWIRAETLEVNHKDKNGPPYKSLGHVAEGILQYVDEGADITSPPPIKSTEYEGIKNSSPAPECSSSNQCSAINCPFKDYHSSYHITCTNVDKLELLLDTPSNEMPAAYPSPGSDTLHFVNFNFDGDSSTSSVNGRNFLLPPVPPQTQPDDFIKQANKCDLSVDCNPTTLACTCTQVLDLPYDKTVQFVLSSVGRGTMAHPIHLHGHSFHVVKVGYPPYNSKTGFIKEVDGPSCGGGNTRKIFVHNSDIECDEPCRDSECPVNGCNPQQCTKPGWKNNQSPPLTISKRTIRKDTVIVPAGGYVVINFKSDNPGYWFLHCHIEVHALEGMNILLNEAGEEQRKLTMPEDLNKCGDFSISAKDYKEMMLMSTNELNAARLAAIYE